MMIHMPAPTRVLICGAGPDAVPVAQAFSELEWEVLVADHRPAFAKADRFPPGTRVIRSRPEKLREAADLSGVDAAVIMSHHLENDAAYLEQLSDCSLSYLGVLGPAARRNRLCEMAQCDPGRVRGPVGLDIGAELPAAIALSVAAEVHAVLNHRDGRSLTLRVSDGAA
jgi:xanthine/CO dehydrogenase XdhC/CoxF family maturation factor